MQQLDHAYEVDEGDVNQDGSDLFQRPKRPENIDPTTYPDDEQNGKDEQMKNPHIKARQYEMMTNNDELLKTTASFSKERSIQNKLAKKQKMPTDITTDAIQKTD